MNETLLDVLLYLFENYADDETEPAANRDTLRAELTAAGFPETQVEHAFAWLARLEHPQSEAQLQAPLPALRIYSADELSRFDAECRGLLLDLERIGVLDVESRELVIELLLPLDMPVDAQLLKWAAMLVVLNRETPAVALSDEAFESDSLDVRAIVEGRLQLQ